MPAISVPAATGTTSTTAADPSTSGAPLPQRLVSLDAYRGLTMFAMASGGIGLREVSHEFPNSPVWRAIGYQTEHVPWVGCSLWDMIQPSFMFIVGVAMIFSCTSREARGQSWGQMAWHAAWRSVVLILLGVFLRFVEYAADQFHVRGRFDADRLGVFFPVPAVE